MCLPTFNTLRAEFGDAADDALTISLAQAQRDGSDPRSVLGYLAGLGRPVVALPDLLAAIMQLEEEEELGAFACVEGVAVSVASDGAWLLYTE